jgi:hypothetical protein
MDALDGNAIAGRLVDVFGVEMTTATGVCGACGDKAVLGEVEVYLRAPGTVARCRRCHSVLIALTTVRGVTCVDLRGLVELEGGPRLRPQE